jgi:hypothetical protein
MMSPLVEDHLLVEDYLWSCGSVSVRIKHLLLVKPLETKLEDRGTEKSGNGAFATQVHMLIRGLLGELSRPYVAVEPGSIEARQVAVPRCMSRVFKEAAVCNVNRGISLCRPGSHSPPLSR